MGKPPCKVLIGLLCLFSGIVSKTQTKEFLYFNVVVMRHNKSIIYSCRVDIQCDLLVIYKMRMRMFSPLGVGEQISIIIHLWRICIFYSPLFTYGDYAFSTVHFSSL